ncbi:MAG: DsbE family thiol:disulfide interchange protein [Hyphomicrobiales bacterium]
MTRRHIWTLIPVAIFILLAALFFKGLFGNPSELPSVLIGKGVPAFNLPAIANGDRPGLADTDLKKGGVSIVNIWASWCAPCRQEHPVLLELAKRTDITLVGINNKDEAENARHFLGAMGNPFAAIGADTDGRVTIDFGGYGVPETFIIDGTGHIRFKHVGPIAPNELTGSFAAEIEKAKQPL